MFGGPSDLNVDSILVLDDNNLDVQFDADAVQTGSYAIRVELTDDASCFSEYGTDFGETPVSVVLA